MSTVSMSTDASVRDRTKAPGDYGSAAATSSTESMDATRKGIVLRGLIGFVKALQDARQREADRVLAHYRDLTREISQRPMTHLF
jgi:hypothetical protein